MRYRSQLLYLVASLVGLALLTGCGGDRLTYDNYARIRDGMTPADVRSILGEPDKDKSGGVAFGGFDASGRVMKWEHGDKWVAVTFVQDKVTTKAQKGL